MGIDIDMQMEFDSAIDIPSPSIGGNDMPDLFEIMESCRAMRRLKPDPVPDELIAKILRAGIYAPNGGNTQKWRFLVVKDPKIKKELQRKYPKHQWR